MKIYCPRRGGRGGGGGREGRGRLAKYQGRWLVEKALDKLKLSGL